MAPATATTPRRTCSPARSRSATSPATAEQCTELGKTDDNSDAAHGAGDCPDAGRVGVCDRGTDGLRVYYEGDPDGLEIGCGFQGGEWKTTAK